jgi:hypothetical protein
MIAQNEIKISICYYAKYYHLCHVITLLYCLILIFPLFNFVENGHTRNTDMFRVFSGDV